ncbi:MAG: transketolase C-terminal domain-containing protein [Chloroflexota bacterium]
MTMPTVLGALNEALHQALSRDERVIILGEDVLDPYGGAFKVTKGLPTKFPSRVMTTPISEAGIVGVAAGMAMRGLMPIVEIMFGDFVTLITDQLINHVAKFPWMYNEQVDVPIVIRTPMGGRRGYGPTHSQTLEKHFLGVPGLHVVTPTMFGNPGELLLHAIFEDKHPVLFIENKLLYPLQIQSADRLPDFDITVSEGDYPTYSLTIRYAPRLDLTLTAYGYMLEPALQAVLRLLYEFEIFTHLIIPTQLAPFDSTILESSVAQSGRLLTVEEGTLTMGWGAEVIARAAERLGPQLRSARRVAALDLPIPASFPLEEAVLPGIEEVVQTARSMVC